MFFLKSFWSAHPKNTLSKIVSTIKKSVYFPVAKIFLVRYDLFFIYADLLQHLHKEFSIIFILSNFVYKRCLETQVDKMKAFINIIGLANNKSSSQIFFPMQRSEQDAG